MTNLNVRIITDDTAVAIGLKQTLANMFDVEASWTRPSAVAAEPDIAADLFIADAGAFCLPAGIFHPQAQPACPAVQLNRRQYRLYAQPPLRRGCISKATRRHNRDVAPQPLRRQRAVAT